jgi:hypothetical protein
VFPQQRGVSQLSSFVCLRRNPASISRTVRKTRGGLRWREGLGMPRHTRGGVRGLEGVGVPRYTRGGIRWREGVGVPRHTRGGVR